MFAINSKRSWTSWWRRIRRKRKRNACFLLNGNFESNFSKWRSLFLDFFKKIWLTLELQDRISTLILHDFQIRWILKIKNFALTLPRKNMNLPYSICMFWTNFWQPTIHVQENIFEKTLLEVGSWYLYTSFGTLYVQIGQLFYAEWVFDKC